MWFKRYVCQASARFLLWRRRILQLIACLMLFFPTPWWSKALSAPCFFLMLRHPPRLSIRAFRFLDKRRIFIEGPWGAHLADLAPPVFFLEHCIVLSFREIHSRKFRQVVLWKDSFEDPQDFFRLQSLRWFLGFL